VEETGKVDIDKLQQLSSSTVSAWSMKRLINLVRYQVRGAGFYMLGV
jgi:predicted nucleic acid-binding Zn ribbon protein